MNIGFDLDRVFIDYPPLIPAAFIDRLYKKKSNGVLSYRIPSRPEQLFRLITHFPIFRPALLENLETVRQSKQHSKDRYFLISSRFSFLSGKTSALIKKHAFEKIFEDMFFNTQNKQPHIFKNGLIKKLRIARYVDDDLPLLEFLARNNPKTNFFWLTQKKGNRTFRNIFPIDNLSDMLQTR